MDLQCLQCLVCYCMVPYMFFYVCVWRMAPFMVPNCPVLSLHGPVLSWSAPFKTQHTKPVSPRLNTFNPAVFFCLPYYHVILYEYLH